MLQSAAVEIVEIVEGVIAMNCEAVTTAQGLR